jgi:acetyl esterase/lipase
MRFLAVLLVLLAAACNPAESLPMSQTATPTLMTWDDLTTRPRPAPTHEVRLGERPWEVAEAWIPEGDGPHPTVIMVHGGCWQKAIADRTLMHWAAEDLRRRGLGVWNIEYRGVDEAGGGYPGTFLDVAAAADALRTHGPRLGLNTERLAAFGHSAGGHLALWLAGRHRLPRESSLWQADPIAIGFVVNSGGLADLEVSAPVTAPSCLAAVLDRLTGAPRSDPFSDTSPVSLLPMGAFQLSVNTPFDRIAPPLLGQAYTARAAAAGDPQGYLEPVSGGHVELIAPGSEPFEAQAIELERFFGR